MSDHKKTSSSGTGGQGTNPTVTFTNSTTASLRLIVTGSGSADTLYPFPNKILDIDVAGKTSVTRTDVPSGKRKIFTFEVCGAQQPLNAACTLHVVKNIEYLAGQSYNEVLQ